MGTSAAVLAILLTCLASRSSVASQRLTILHSNDVHRHLRPFSHHAIESPGSLFADLPVRRDIGGIARRATLGPRLEVLWSGVGPSAPQGPCG